MSKIIGVTVGTPLSTAKIREKINPVTSVNGIEPDEAGNVNVSVGGGGTGGTYDIGQGLKVEKGVLSVNTTDVVEANNQLPITSAAVHTTVGNIEVLLKTI